MDQIFLACRVMMMKRSIADDNDEVEKNPSHINYDLKRNLIEIALKKFIARV